MSVTEKDKINKKSGTCHQTFKKKKVYSKNIRGRNLFYKGVKKSIFSSIFRRLFLRINFFAKWVRRGYEAAVQYDKAGGRPHHSTKHRHHTSLLQLGRAGGRVGPVLYTAFGLCGNNSNENRGTRVYLLVSIQIGQFIYRDVFWEFMNVRRGHRATIQTGSGTGTPSSKEKTPPCRR